MPQRRNAIKDLRKNRTRHLRNLDIKTELKKTIKKAVTGAANKDADNKALLNDIYQKFDKAAKRKVMHKRTAARRKAMYAKMLNAKPEAAKAETKKAAKKKA